MNKYRKNPIIVEAIKLTRNFAEMARDFVGADNIAMYNLGEFAEDSCFIEITTLEGNMTANEGDYIIKGIRGEFYPCNPEIFKATYEPVAEDEND